MWLVRETPWQPTCCWSFPGWWLSSSPSPCSWRRRASPTGQLQSGSEWRDAGLATKCWLESWIQFFKTFKWTVRIILGDKEGPVLFRTGPLKLLSDIINVTMLTIWGNSTEIPRNLFQNSTDLVSRNSWGQENPGNLLQEILLFLK